jgi:hypothetical protein
MRKKQRKERAARRYTEAQKVEMWDRWGRGESLTTIGLVFGKDGGSVYGQLAPYGKKRGDNARFVDGSTLTGSHSEERGWRRGARCSSASSRGLRRRANDMPSRWGSGY